SSCVQCSSDSHCSGATPSCDLGSHTCVAADGGTDAGACIEGATQPCYDGPNGTVGVGPCHAGSQQCTNGAWSACANEQLPGTETCNTADDDCNGAVDDGVTQACYTGPAGTKGVGACKPGTQTCSAGQFGACIGQVTPVAESCNNVDDD